jgi:hypothetical protein
MNLSGWTSNCPASPRAGQRLEQRLYLRVKRRSQAVLRADLPGPGRLQRLLGLHHGITAHSPYKVGVYSSPGIWASIFGTGSDSLIPHTVMICAARPAREGCDWPGRGPLGRCLLLVGAPAGVPAFLLAGI